MSDIEHLIEEFVARAGVVASTNLSLAGDPWSDREASSIAGDMGFMISQEDGTYRAWPHQVHIPLENIKELGQLIQAELPQKLADGGVMVLVLFHQPLPDLQLRTQIHAAKLVDVKDLLVLAHPSPCVERRSFRAQLDRQSDEQEERREQEDP